MAGITLAQAQAKLDEYLAAETAILSGQSYKIGERELRRADLAVIQQGIDTWNRRVGELTASSGGRRRAIVPRPSF